MASFTTLEVNSGLFTGTLRAAPIERRLCAMARQGWKFEKAVPVTGRCLCVFSRYKMLLVFSRKDAGAGGSSLRKPVFGRDDGRLDISNIAGMLAIALCIVLFAVPALRDGMPSLSGGGDSGGSHKATRQEWSDGTYADIRFGKDGGVVSVFLSNNMKVLDDNFCKDITTLKTVALPEGLERIGHYAFSGCDSLTTVTLGKNVEFIGAGAFRPCASLKKLKILSREPPMLGCFLRNGEEVYNNFPLNEGFKIYVPKGSLDTYLNTKGWDLYESYLKGY